MLVVVVLVVGLVDMGRGLRMRDVVSVWVWVTPGWLESPWLPALDAQSFQAAAEENRLEPRVGGILCELKLDVEDKEVVDNTETLLELQGGRAKEESRSTVVWGRIGCDLGGNLRGTKHRVYV